MEMEMEMKNERVKTSQESYVMNRGTGTYSYAQNSTRQREASESAQGIIGDEIRKKLDIQQLLSSRNFPHFSFRVADFGCATGPNTILAVQAIIEAVELKFQSQCQSPPEFQAYFSDHVSNDFNTLFANLPRERRYYAAAVPGSFHALLFPKASLHFAYSACTLNWLSEVPEDLTDKASPAYNTGRIHYVGPRKEVSEAYSAQFAVDFESFLIARAQELVGGGLMAIILPGLAGQLFSQTSTGLLFQVFESCLASFADMGLISKEKVDSFNLPVYFPSLDEVEAVIEGNEHFTTERIEALDNPNAADSETWTKESVLHLRAALEDIIGKHFGTDTASELFDQFSRNVGEYSLLLDPSIQNTKVLVLVLKRRVDAATS